MKRFSLDSSLERVNFDYTRPQKTKSHKNSIVPEKSFTIKIGSNQPLNNHRYKSVLGLLNLFKPLSCKISKA